MTSVPSIPALYINLDRRPDRRETMEKVMQEYWPSGATYERVVAVDTPQFGPVGCLLSHASCLKIARDRGWSVVAVLEDDLEFLQSPAEWLSFLPDKFDVFMMAPKVIRGEISPMSPWIRLVEAQNACGYIVRSHYYETLIGLFEQSALLLGRTGRHHRYATDQTWKTLQPVGRWFCFADRKIARQRAGWSDINNSWVEYDF